MKINWGTAIVIVFVLFAGMLTYYMIKGAQNPSDLVTKDYYEQEIRYQERINQITNAKGLSLLTVTEGDGFLQIIYPEDLSTQNATGKVHFYRPNNSNIDFELPLEFLDQLSQSIDTKSLAKGRWILKIEIKSEGKDYYWEKAVSV